MRITVTTMDHAGFVSLWTGNAVPLPYPKTSWRLRMFRRFPDYPHVLTR